MSKQGPTIAVTVSCGDCQYLRSEYYAVQSDTGFHHWCLHPNVAERNRILESRRTPDWCPFLPDAVVEACQREAHNRMKINMYINQTEQQSNKDDK